MTAVKTSFKTDAQVSHLATDDDVRRLVAEKKALEDALRPFADFAEDNIEHGAWGGNRCERERINVWFGPSDFERARAALRSEQGETDE